MGHELTSSDAMFSVREMPWHGLGVVLPDNPTREDAQKIAHPWEPVETPVYKRVPVIDPDGTPRTDYVEVSGSKGIERSDNGDTLGVVNSTQGLVLNNDLWDVAEVVLDAENADGPQAVIETGGSLRGGRDVFALLRFAEPIQIAGDPNGGTFAFFALQNNHVSQGAFRGQGINTRIVCANTSAAADAEAKASGYEFRFRHSTNVGQRVEQAKEAVRMWRDGVIMWQNAMEHLVTVKVTAAQRETFIEQFQPMPANHLITDRVRSNVESARAELRAILNGPTAEGIDLTAYGLYMAGIEWAQHVRKVKGKDDRSRMESYFRRNMLTDAGLRKATLTLAQEVVHA